MTSTTTTTNNQWISSNKYKTSRQHYNSRTAERNSWCGRTILNRR